MKIFLALLPLVLATPAAAYYGRNATEAVLSFDAVLDVPYPGPVDLAAWNGAGDVHDRMIEAVRTQVLHLDGVFHSEDFAKKWGGPASCGPWYEKGNFRATFTEVVPGADSGRARVRYHFEATIVVQKDPLRRNENADMQIWLPYASDLIYGYGVVKKKNLCTDAEDNAPDSFYYYWDPHRAGCPLLKTHPESIQWITANVKRLANTRISYPQYDQLYKDGLPKPTVNIAIFWGYISHGMKARKPYYRDDGYAAMKLVTDNLKDIGYRETEYRPHFAVSADGALDESGGPNVSRKMEKNVKVGDRDVLVRISMLLSDTAIGATDPTFHYYVKPALNDADIFIYDGHSGDGDNLSPTKLGLSPPTAEKYQVFFINGCDSYINYLSQFVTARGGLNKLDLVISGTPTDAAASAPNDWAFLEPFANLRTLSYQKMLDTIEKSYPQDSTFLLGVKGDEKNTWRPR
jgi:hypothetical protein